MFNPHALGGTNITEIIDHIGQPTAENSEENAANTISEVLTLESEHFAPGTIITSIENKFFMMRQWSLLEAMSHSNYMVSKLKLWRQSGKEDLQKFISSLGVANVDAK